MLIYNLLPRNIELIPTKKIINLLNIFKVNNLHKYYKIINYKYLKKTNKFLFYFIIFFMLNF